MSFCMGHEVTLDMKRTFLQPAVAFLHPLS
jgi:hypothetical protein